MPEGFVLGKYRLVGKYLVDENEAEMVFEVHDPLQVMRFTTVEKKTRIRVPLVVAEEHRLGRRYTIVCKPDGQLEVQP